MPQGGSTRLPADRLPDDPRQFRLLPLEVGDPGVPGPENVARICASQFEEISGSTAGRHRFHPWKSPVVRVCTPQGAVHRLVLGHGAHSIPRGKVWLGPGTRSQLGLEDGDCVRLESVWQPWGRLLYYHGHREDAVRSTFRIGLWGLGFALLLSLGLSLWQVLR